MGYLLCALENRQLVKIIQTERNSHMPIGMCHRILYTAPLLTLIPLIAPILIVQGIYVKHYNVSLTAIASVILFVRVFDALTDPIIGFLSDRDRLKLGTRKPYMIAGALITLGSGYCLYSPPDNANTVYFAVWFTLVYIGFTLFGIPHIAWGGEISNDTHDKTQIYNLRTAASYTGVILFYSIPLFPIWKTTEITPETLKFGSTISILFTIPILYFCIKYVPDGNCFNIEKDTINSSNRSNKPKFEIFTETLNSIRYNKPLLIFLGAFIFSGISLGMWYGLIFIFIDAYLKKGDIFAEINLIVFVVGVLSSFAWVKLSRIIGKKFTWLLSMLLGIAGFIYTGFLHPENATYISILLLLTLNIICYICADSLPQSMLSDIVDYATLRFKVYRGSTYYSLFLFVYKGAGAIGAALGLAITGWYGFDPSATTHTDHEIAGLIMAMTWIPILLALIAIFFIYLSPISLQRYRIIRRRLDSLGARLEFEKVLPSSDISVKRTFLEKPNN